MTLPSPGSAIAFSQIQTEFGGSNPISISEYYGGTTNERSYFNGSSWALIPTSGIINCSQFFSSAAQFAIGHFPYTDYAYGQYGSGSYGNYTFGAGHSRTIGIVAIGGGGGGGGGSSRNWNYGTVQGGTGGGGGEMRGTTMVITPNQSIKIKVGHGGAGGEGSSTYVFPQVYNGAGGGYSGALNPAETAWHVLAYGGGGGQGASISTYVNNQYVGAAGGTSGVGSFISPGNVGGRGPYTTAGSGKNIVVATQGGGFGGAGVYFHTFSRPGGGPTAWGSNITHSNGAANNPGYGTFNWHGMAGTSPGPHASGYNNSYFGVGGGGGGGGINNNDNNFAYYGGAGQNGAVLIFW